MAYNLYDDKSLETLSTNMHRFVEAVIPSIETLFTAEVIQRLNESRALDDLFLCLWRNEYIQTMKLFDLYDAPKSDSRSESYRKLGNDLSRVFAYPEALKNFNKSIVFAVHSNDSKCLAHGYACRSALLFELEDYDACLVDIDKAIKCQFPSLLKPQLIERKIKCHIMQDDKDKAKDTLKKYRTEVNSLTSIEAKILREAVKKLEVFLNTYKPEENVPPFRQTEEFEAQQLQLCIPEPEAPELRDPTPTMPSLSTAAAIAYSDEKGRHVVATRDILPGEVLLKEKSYAAAVDKARLLSHCTFCLKKTFTPVPCPNCSHIVFCSDACAVEARRLFHDVECPVLPTLMKSIAHSPVPFRILLMTSVDELKQNIPLYDFEKAEKKPLELGYDDRGVYVSSDFRSIYLLTNHSTRMSIHELVLAGIKAVWFVKLLVLVNYFGSTIKDIQDDDLALVGKTVMTILLAFKINGLGVAEFGSQTHKCQTIGNALYATFSLFNHSCNPLTIKTCTGTDLVVRATHFIKAGAEITCCYGPIFAFNDIKSRQMELFERYYFHCNCEACLGCWPMLEGLEKKTHFQCYECKEKFLLLKDQCPNCGYEITKQLYSGKRAAHINNEVKEAKDLIQTLWLKKFTNGDVTQPIYYFHLSDWNAKTILRAVQCLNMYVAFPSKIFIVAQKLLEIYYDTKGSQFND